MHINKNSLRRSLSVACAGGALLLSGPGLAHEGHDQAEHAAANAAAAGTSDYKRTQQSYAIPDLVLIDADSRPVKLRELLATKDPVMMNFIFTTCTAICPVMTKIFSEVPAKLGAEAGKVRMISISIDPENDRPAQLKSYAKGYGAGERWTFLTGKVEDIKAVQRAFDNYRGDKMNHEPVTLLRAAPGKPWVRIDGFASPAALAGEYRKVVLQ